jgi:molybdopterin-guanine dinucleotide biosynthesis protein B
MTPVDLLLVEGFKREAHDKLEIYRAANGKPLLAAEDPNIVAVLVDGPKPETGIPQGLPVIDLNDTAAIADFVMRHCGFFGK